MRSIRRHAAAVLLAVSGASLLLVHGANAADRTERGATLIVPQEHANLGTVYYVLPGKDGQITFTSDAPFEHIKGTSNRVIGYAVAPTDAAARGSLLAAEFVLPVASLNTGIPMRDEHLQSERWLGAAANPDIRFTISSVADAAVEKQDAKFTTWTVNLHGTMTISGTSREMVIPARITSMPENEQTKARAPGDLLAIRCEFSVKLAEFGVATNESAVQVGKVSDEISIDTFLMLSTVSPETPRN